MTTYKGTDPVNRLWYAHLPTTFSAWLATAAPIVLPPGATPPAADGYAYLPFVRAIDNFEAQWEVLANDGARFYLKTNLDAPRYRVVAAEFPADAAGVATIVTHETTSPTPRTVDVVPHSDRDVLDWASVVSGRHLCLCYMRDVVNVVVVARLPATPPPFPAVDDAAATAALRIQPDCDLPLPTPCTVTGFSGRRDQNVAFVKVVSPLLPGSIYRVAFGSDVIAAPPSVSAIASRDGTALGTVSGWAHIRVPGFDATAYKVEQRFVPSEDGTVRIPLFLVTKAGSPTSSGDGSATGGTPPVLLYAYGGFNISIQPTFSAPRLAWFNDCGGVWALAW